MQEPSLPGAGAGRDPDRGELVYFWFVCLFTVKSEEMFGSLTGAKK